MSRLPDPAPSPAPASPQHEMTPAQHYREAERLAHSAATYMSTGRADTASARAIVALAQVHATLALGDRLFSNGDAATPDDLPARQQAHG